MFKRITAFLIIITLAVGMCNTTLFSHAESLSDIKVDQDASNELLLYGDAKKQTDGSVLLTPLEVWKAGSAWYRKQIITTKGFSTEVSYWAGGGRGESHGGADGIAITFSNNTGLGSAGEDLGFMSDGSYGIELDSYPENSGDPSGKHIAIIKDSVSNHLAYKLDDRVDDSNWHKLRISYDNNTFQIYLDGAMVLSKNGIQLSERVYLGISAATGDGINKHVVKDFFFQGVVSRDNELSGNYPVIIVPGIMGSRLFSDQNVFNGSTKIWDPEKDLSGLNKLKKNIERSDLYVRPCEEQHQYSNGGDASAYKREYGADNNYADIVNDLCNNFTEAERRIYFFSYDWRHSNYFSAQDLANFIETLDTDKVDIVCHSMGGLVVSKYYSLYGTEKINKIITCGTPYEGAPKLINAVENWDVLGSGASLTNDTDKNDFFLAVFGGLTKNIKKQFMGVTELTPTENYVNRISMQKDSWKPFSKGDYDLSLDDYKKICRDIFGSDNYNAASVFQESLHDDSGFNGLLNYDKSYFIMGINHKTISSIKFQYSNNDIDQKLYESDLNYDILGDGTVPYYSSSICEKIERLDKSRWKRFDVDHGETINDKKCREWIIDILNSNDSYTAEDELNSSNYKVVRIACPVDVKITKQGETLQYQEKGSSDTSASFGRMDVLGLNDEIKMFCLDDEDDYTVTLNGTDKGTMDYEVRYFDTNNNMVDDRIFEDVPVTDNTVIKTDLNLNNDTVLKIDNNNDGKIDATWTAGRNKKTNKADETAHVKATSIKLEGLSKKIAAGKKIKLKATVLPKNASNKSVKWTSSNTKVATVSSDGTVRIKKKTGGKTVTITATAADGSGKQATWKIKVMKGKVKKITLKAPKKTLKAGKSMKLKVKVKATKGANKNLLWTVSNKKYATINKNGKLKTLKAGKGKTIKVKVMSTDGTNKKKEIKVKIK